MEQEIDVRQYIVAILRRWPWIVACALLAALIAFSVSMAMPKTYRATASMLVFIRQTGSQVGANDPVLKIETIDVAARRQGLIALAESETIEAQLPSDITQRAVAAPYRPGMIVQRELIEATAQGDLLEIEATAGSPEQAQALANAWADTYAAHVAELYTDQHSTVQRAGTALLPLAPSGPATARNTATAALAGMLLGITLALVSSLTGALSTTPARTPNERPAAHPSPTR